MVLKGIHSNSLGWSQQWKRSINGLISVLVSEIANYKYRICSETFLITISDVIDISSLYSWVFDDVPWLPLTNSSHKFSFFFQNATTTNESLNISLLSQPLFNMSLLSQPLLNMFCGKLSCVVLVFLCDYEKHFLALVLISTSELSNDISSLLIGEIEWNVNKHSVKKSIVERLFYVFKFKFIAMFLFLNFLVFALSFTN